jgi:hypothetical protein
MSDANFSRVTRNLSLTVNVDNIPAEDAFMLLDSLLRRLVDNSLLQEHVSVMTKLYRHIQANIDRDRSARLFKEGA